MNLIINSALASLPAPWQTWITDNLNRGCEPSSMAEIMLRDGGFDACLAYAAIEEARRKRFGTPIPVKRRLPAIDASSNMLRLADREVSILMKLESPHVVVLGNFLSKQECDDMIRYCEQRLERSPVVDDGDGSLAVHAHRTSRGAMLQRGESELVARIETRIASLINWPVENGEGLQLLRYASGNEYRPHYDWFDPDRPGPRKHLERGGQRVATVILYLSDVEQGGGTSFPNAGFQVQPKKGSAVFFLNVDPHGMPDAQSLHAGEPVVQGVKFIATKWLRERAYV